MLQSIDATDRVREEVLCLHVQVNQPNGNHEALSEIFIAPTPVVKAFAEFLCRRDEDEQFHVKDNRVRFQDLNVSCGDSNQAVLAYECLRHYDVPLGNYSICSDLIRGTDRYSESGSDSSHEGDQWVSDRFFQRFKAWYLSVHPELRGEPKSFIDNEV